LDLERINEEPCSTFASSRRVVTSALSVVIPTRNRPSLLARCLETVAASVRPHDEVIVVDSSDAGVDVADTAEGFGARLVRCGRAGASYQRNVGAAEARHELLAFLDDDVRVSPLWAPSLASAFATHPNAAFLTGRVEVPPDQVGYSRPVSIKADPEPAPLTASTRGTLGHSANVAVRRAAFNRVGGFDEGLGPGTPLPAAEDSDLFDRLFSAGYQGRYEPAALAWHDQWRTRRQLVRLEWSYGIGTGARLARLARSDRARARALVSEDLWGNGLKILPTLLRQRYEFGVLFVLARLAGASTGYVRAARSGFAAAPPSERG
jgi:GT2 family glycosyltransferase